MGDTGLALGQVWTMGPQESASSLTLGGIAERSARASVLLGLPGAWTPGASLEGLQPTGLSCTRVVRGPGSRRAGMILGLWVVVVWHWCGLGAWVHRNLHELWEQACCGVCGEVGCSLHSPFPFSSGGCLGLGEWWWG